MRLADLGELGLLAELERRRLVGPIADDAASLRDGLVVTQDALVEGIHFRLDWTSWRDLGYKAAAVNLSDLAASGAEPEGLLVTLSAPGVTSVDDVLELYEGIAETGVAVVGGDTTDAERVSLGVTALGRSERVPGRGGAQAGDCSSSPGRSEPRRRASTACAAAGRARWSTRTAGRRSGWTRDAGSPGAPTRSWTSRTVSQRMPATSPAAPAAGS